MVDPKAGDTGKRVSYQCNGPTKSGYACDVYRDGKWRHVERGVITSWNDTYVFVRFSEDCHSKACTRESLEWGSVSVT